jgi:hypothetical protein
MRHVISQYSVTRIVARVIVTRVAALLILTWAPTGSATDDNGRASQQPAYDIRLEKSGVRVEESRFYQWPLHLTQSESVACTAGVPQSLDAAVNKLASLLDTVPRAMLYKASARARERLSRFGGTSADMAKEVALQFTAITEERYPDEGQYLSAISNWIEDCWLWKTEGPTTGESSASPLRLYFQLRSVVTTRRMREAILSALAFTLAGSARSESAILDTFVLLDRPYRTPESYSATGCTAPLVRSAPGIWMESLGADEGRIVYHVATCPVDGSVWFFNESVGWFALPSIGRRVFCHAMSPTYPDYCRAMQ